MGRSSNSAAADLIAFLKQIDPQDHSEDERRLLLAASKALVGRLSTGWEQTWQATVTDSVKLAALRTLVLMDPFESWCRSGWKPATSAEVVQHCRAASSIDVNLMTRLLDVASACHLLLREGDLYSPGPYDWAPALAQDPTLRGSLLGFVDWTTPLFTHLPHFLQHSGFKNPDEGNAANYQHLYQRDGSEIYLGLANDPNLSQGVRDFMQANTRYTLTPWTRICPLATVLDGVQDGQVLIVDVGGGNGQDLRQVAEQQKLPPGSLVLQDLPNVVDAVDVSDCKEIITKQAYNYMEPQPVVGARYYYFKNIIHNLPDELAVKVLRNQAEAMTNESRLLIYERFKGIPGDPASPEFVAYSSLTAQDVFMMGMFSSQERWQEQYEAILQRAGFEVLQIHEPKAEDGLRTAQFSRDRIIEAKRR